MQAFLLIYDKKTKIRKKVVLDWAGVLGAVRRALRAASDSPAVLGMRRAIQTGDVPYIALCVALLAAFCTMFAAVIVIIAGKRRSGKEEN